MTGVDFSARSIDYAKSSALKKGLDITYHFQDYLTMNLNTSYDFATMIYCDYGALSPTTAYYLWTSYFTKDDLIKEAKNAGFKAYTVFGDVAGTPYSEDNFTISILLGK